MSKVFKSVKDVPREELLAPGHRLCAGCAAGTAVRQILKASGRDVVVVSPTGCLEVSTSYFPQSAWRVPWVHVAFENAAAVAAGISNALKVMKRKGKTEEKADVIAIGGDGGTFDIGLQSLSGALERGDDILYVCYDNEAYMNTGIQRSSATPFGAATTTSPPGKRSIGQRTEKKDLVGIAMAHGIPYAATACPSYPFDLMNKVRKGLDVDGPALIHILTPCPTGWRTDTSDSIELGKLAVLTGLWPLYEAVNGEVRLTVQVPRREPVTKYLKAQGRFKHLDEETVKRIQEKADGLAKKFGMGPLREQQ
ncbi:MAG: pyruvate synthase subunit PorB [Candidatus Methanosuratincola sp.]|uniref:Pyruvate:ferredoxin oxidoreductase, beta subunit n=1 Tax=Methanosuratincola subterraneus TaxID=2593994 RepID=A0A3S3S8E3_METS7|nr:MAG: Pyruvate:ferredoxin oxidoreductase, beta subunit [Candidatus Methanosuratincola subterraneus]